MTNTLSKTELDFIDQFLTTQQILDNPHYLAIALYGSTVQNTRHQNIDIDIFIISNLMNNLKIGKVFQNVRFDISVYSLEHLYDLVYQYKKENNTYFEAVFQNHLVIKDSLHTFQELHYYMESLPKLSKKRPLTSKQIEQVSELYDCFLGTKNEQDASFQQYWYYNLLEDIRILNYQLRNCSYINPYKVYDCYTKESYAKNYLLDMPSNYFIKTFLDALSAKEFDQKEKNIETLFSYLNIEPKQDVFLPDSFPFLSKSAIQLDLLGIRNNLSRCEMMLQKNHPYSEYAYSILLRRMSKYSQKIYSNDLSRELSLAVSTREPLEKIDQLHYIYRNLSRDYSFDYDDYQLILRR